MAKDLNTEQKIKEAARKVFLQKGYAAARTRDIAEGAGINLALLNYYFRSKEKLFHQIMEESLRTFVGQVFPVLSDPEVSLEEKIPFFVGHYTEVLLENPELPTFILGELRSDPGHILDTIGQAGRGGLAVLAGQIEEGQKQGRIVDVSPWNFLLSLVGLTVFPFVARPLVQYIGKVSDEQFKTLMEERKALINDMLCGYIFIEKRKG